MRLAVLVLMATACGRLSFDPVENGDITVGFERDMSFVDETSGTITIPVRLSSASDQPISVAFEAASGTATSGADFTGSSNGTLIFAPGDLEKAVVLTITDDGVSEPDETFEITLSAPAGAALAAATHTITISAAALPRINFEHGLSTDGESGATFIAVVLDVPSAIEITVDYVVDGIDDYTLRSGTIVFAPGQTRIELALGEVQDLLDEDDDAVVISLEHPVNGVLGTVTQHTHTIVDDDPLPTLAFVLSNSTSVAESGTITFTVELSAPSGRTVTVTAVRAGGSVGEDDVTFSATLLTFPPGVTTQQFTATIVTDDIDEPDEQFGVALEAPSNAVIGEGVGQQFVTLLDDDPPPAVSWDPSESDGSALEGSNPAVLGTVDYTLVLSAPSGKTVSVNLDVSTGTATPNDFSISNSTVIFAPGETSKTVTLGIIGDSQAEPDETVVMTIVLSPAGSNAQLGAIVTRTHTILNDD